jgi:nicotinamidase-related amidase
MKKSAGPVLYILFSLLICPFLGANAEEASDGTALLLIDIQDFYFSGSSALVEPEAAAENAASLLGHFRKEGGQVVHIRHEASSGGDIHRLVAPEAGEKVITKKSVNAFKETDLLEFLREKGVDKLVVCGMMTHMCLEAAVRAAADLGFQVTVIADACATRDLQFGGSTVSATDVHTSTLASLYRYYGEVLDTASYLSRH